MPKLRESFGTQKNKEVQMMIRVGMARVGINQKELAGRMLLSPQTVSYKLRNPGALTLDELWRACEVLKIKEFPESQAK
jgi:transcriptional regulator with XRE-family HTH domain